MQGVIQAEELERSIERCVAFFSLFEYPLTVFEVWKWMDRAASYAQVDRLLCESVYLRGRVAREGGFVSHARRSAEASVRAERFLDAQRKFKRLRWITRYIGWIPSVRLVAACNTLAWSNTRAESDIDLYIVTRPGTIWVTRLLCVTPFQMLGWRPGQAARDPICFSFFATSDRLELASLQLAPADPYLSLWTSALIPVLDRGVFTEFESRNHWARACFPQSHAYTPVRARRVYTRRARAHVRAHAHVRVTERLAVAPLRRLDRLARWLQYSRFSPRVRALMNKDSRVIVDDGMLKFHENDRRATYRKQWEELCRLNVL